MDDGLKIKESRLKDFYHRFFTEFSQSKRLVIQKLLKKPMQSGVGIGIGIAVAIDFDFDFDFDTDTDTDKRLKKKIG